MFRERYCISMKNEKFYVSWMKSTLHFLAHGFLHFHQCPPLDHERDLGLETPYEPAFSVTYYLKSRNATNS